MYDLIITQYNYHLEYVRGHWKNWEGEGLPSIHDNEPVYVDGYHDYAPVAQIIITFDTPLEAVEGYLAALHGEFAPFVPTAEEVLIDTGWATLELNDFTTPCPFCGSDRLGLGRGRSKGYYIYCGVSQCGGKGGRSRSLPQAIRKWNNRKASILSDTPWRKLLDEIQP